jgi:hypothetical protein
VRACLRHAARRRLAPRYGAACAPRRLRAPHDTRTRPLTRRGARSGGAAPRLAPWRILSRGGLTAHGATSDWAAVAPPQQQRGACLTPGAAAELQRRFVGGAGAPARCAAGAIPPHGALRFLPPQGVLPSGGITSCLDDAALEAQAVRPTARAAAAPARALRAPGREARVRQPRRRG